VRSPIFFVVKMADNNAEEDKLNAPEPENVEDEGGEGGEENPEEDGDDNGDGNGSDDEENLANKVHVLNVHKFLTGTTLLKELAKRNIYPVKVRKAPKAAWAVLRFKDTEARDQAIPLLNQIELKGRKVILFIYMYLQ
jgi:hypothetical protein